MGTTEIRNSCWVSDMGPREPLTRLHLSVLSRPLASSRTRSLQLVASRHRAFVQPTGLQPSRLPAQDLVLCLSSLSSFWLPRSQGPAPPPSAPSTHFPWWISQLQPVVNSDFCLPSWRIQKDLSLKENNQAYNFSIKNEGHLFATLD